MTGEKVDPADLHIVRDRTVDHHQQFLGIQPVHLPEIEKQFRERFRSLPRGLPYPVLTGLGVVACIEVLILLVVVDQAAEFQGHKPLDQFFLVKPLEPGID